MDLYTAEKLVDYKQAELRAEAARAAIDAAWVRNRLPSIGAIGVAAGLLRRRAIRAWNGRINGAAMLPKASR